MAKLGRIRRQRASDLVFDALRESILTQVFQPGERLNPDDLATRLDVSLTPIKEALARLTAEGLIVVKPRSGTFVAELSADEVGETFEIRGALEALAAERLVSRVTDEHLGRFRDLVATMERPVSTERERSAHGRANSEFHDLFVELAGSVKLRQIYRSLHAHITIARVHYSREGWAQRIAHEKREHRAILAALEARDVARLVKAVRHHIQRAAQSLVNDLRERPVRPPERAR